MNHLDMIEQAKKAAFESGDPYGFSHYLNIRAEFIPTASRSTLSKFKGRVVWTVDGKRSTKEKVKELIG